MSFQQIQKYVTALLFGIVCTGSVTATAQELTAEQYYERGKKETTASKFDDAVSDFTIAIQKNPEYWKAYANRGSARYYAKNYQGALEDINIGIAHLPPTKSLNDFRDLIQKAITNQSVGMQTVRVSRTVNAGIPTTPAQQIAALAATLRAHGRKIPSNLVKPFPQDLVHPNATSLLPGATAGNSTSPSEHSPSQQFVDRGTEKMKAADIAGASKDFDEAIAIDSNFGAAYASRGSARFNLGDHQGALNDFNKAVQLMPENTTVRDLRDKVAAALQQLNEASGGK